MAAGEDPFTFTLPPGFRFHPTDEELITHYLSPKALDGDFTTDVIGDVDLNKVEPWDLPWMAKMGEVEWYFFCVRDRKYPTGLRTNRATKQGYWKATGKDKEIFRAKVLVGMKKTLVFYRGRAPKGQKTHWVMHEYRLHTKIAADQKEWVISRVFMKSHGGKKVHMSRIIRTPDAGEASFSGDMPPLINHSGERMSPSSNQILFSCKDQQSLLLKRFVENDRGVRKQFPKEEEGEELLPDIAGESDLTTGCDYDDDFQNCFWNNYSFLEGNGL